MLKYEIDKFLYDLIKRLKAAKGGIAPFLSALSGYVFLGKKSRQNGTHITTCWLTFCYFPVAALDTYRITSDSATGVFPRVYGLDDLIPYDRKEVEFDYVQALSYGFMAWTLLASVIFFAFVYPLVTLGMAFVGILFFSLYQLRRNSKEDSQNLHTSISDLRARLEETAKPVEKPKPAPAKATATAAPAVVLDRKPAKKAPIVPIAPRAVERQSVPRINARFSNFAHQLPTREVIIQEEPGNGLMFFGILNILLVFGYVFYYGYFIVDSSATGYMLWVYKIVVLLTKAHLISFITFNLGLCIMFFRSRIVGFMLIALALALFFNLHVNLWNFLLTN